MQFSDIKFTKRDRSYGSSTGLSVGGYWVTKDLFDLMWLKATTELPKLDCSKPQTVVTIFRDSNGWNSYPYGARIALGRCLKFFADHDMVPICVANPTKKGTRKYVRK